MTSRDPHPCITPPEGDGKTLKEVSARGEIHSDAKSLVLQSAECFDGIND